MKKFRQIVFLACGLLLTLAAFPVFAQEKSADEFKINLRPMQDLAQVVSEQSTVERAKNISSGLNLLVQMVSILDKDGQKKLDDDARILINGIAVGNQGKNLTLEFVYEKSVVQELINRKLKEAEAKQSSE